MSVLCRSISYSRSPSRYSYSGSEGLASASPGLVKKKDKAKKKEKKRKHKKEKKQKSRTREAVLDQPALAEQPIARDSFLLPPRTAVCHSRQHLRLSVLSSSISLLSRPSQIRACIYKPNFIACKGLLKQQ